VGEKNPPLLAIFVGDEKRCMTSDKKKVKINYPHQ
jgi:hypothetical protein